MNVRIKVYDDCKYDPKSVLINVVTYKNIKEFKVETKTDDEMYAEGFDEFDEYGEYLVITLEDGDTATFRNSHVDMFKD